MPKPLIVASVQKTKLSMFADMGILNGRSERMTPQGLKPEELSEVYRTGWARKCRKNSEFICLFTITLKVITLISPM